MTITSADTEISAPHSAESGSSRAHGPQVSVVIPSFNEEGNVDELLRRLVAGLPAGLSAEVIFVDDSTDGTPAAVLDAATRFPLPITLIHRDVPAGGLGGAVVEGLRAAAAPWAVVMDADLQHPPALVPELFATGVRTGSDVVVATRYADGGDGSGLGSSYRHAVSRGSKVLAAKVLGGPVGRMSDPLSGFFAVRTAALDLDAVDPIGYKILLELVVRSRLTRIAELPYEFGVRHAGESKSTIREGLRFLHHLLVLRTRGDRLPRRATRRQHGDNESARTYDRSGDRALPGVTQAEAFAMVSPAAVYPR
ncbi:MAG: polyprenol monophosphomannose synthase [Pseudonocardia sp.]|nr:polyprenol monophosphomannose synthase [Pseudonocardia sp.]